MGCNYPRYGWQMKKGEPLKFKEPPFARPEHLVTVPCNNCLGCKMDYARMWAARMYHESLYHSQCCFITLTYDQEHLPERESLQRRDFQEFAKRLRYEATGQEIKIVYCGEYGTKGGRPHYHAILFGTDFCDRVPVGQGLSGDTRQRGRPRALYSSATLSRLWGHGFVSVGDATVQAFVYVAKYVVKKSHGAASSLEYVDLSTGEVQEKYPEFLQASRGIGRRFYEDYKHQLYAHDYCIIQGRKQKLPRYYDEIYKKENPTHYAQIQAARKEKSEEVPQWDKYVLRGDVKEKVLLSNYRIRGRGKFEE